jgi:DNA-binding NarL/FixJ family response regulator
MIENLISGVYGYFTKTMLSKELLEEIKNAADLDSTTCTANPSKMVIILKNLDNKYEDKQNILSQRENEVLSEIALGKRYKQIAETLFISVNTIRFHMKNIYQKFNVHSQPEAIAIALRKGLI